MTNKEAIKFLKQLYPNGGHCWLDEQRIEAIGMAIAALEQKGAASENLEKVVEDYTRKVLERTNCLMGNQHVGEEISKAVEFGANWQKGQMMAKAVDVTIAIPYPRLDGVYTQLVDSKEALPFGDNIKVLVIKED